MIESDTGQVALPAGGALDVGIPPVGMLAGIEPEVGVLDVGVPLGGADGIVEPPLPCINAAHSCCWVEVNVAANIGFCFKASAVYGQAASAIFAPPAIARPDAMVAPAMNLRMNMVPPLSYSNTRHDRQSDTSYCLKF